MKKTKKELYLLRGAPTDAEIEKFVEVMIAADRKQTQPDKTKRKKAK